MNRRQCPDEDRQASVGLGPGSCEEPISDFSLDGDMLGSAVLPRRQKAHQRAGGTVREVRHQGERTPREGLLKFHGECSLVLEAVGPDQGDLVPQTFLEDARKVSIELAGHHGAASVQEGFRQGSGSRAHFKDQIGLTDI